MVERILRDGVRQDPPPRLTSRGTTDRGTGQSASHTIGERLGTDVLAIGTRSAGSLSHHTSSLAPNRCAAHPEPFSYVDVDALALALTLTLALM